jgi:hypothetical protein
MFSGMRRLACQSQAWCGQSHAGSRPGNRWRPSEQRACSGGGDGGHLLASGAASARW